MRWRGGELRRHGDRLFALTQPRAHASRAADPSTGTGARSPGCALADGGALGLVRERHGDVRLAALPPRLTVRFRRGGERLQSAHGRVALKDLLQAQGVAPWERPRCR